MQQGRDRLQVRVGHAPALRRPVHQNMGQGHDGHALVVGHERAHRYIGLCAGAPWHRVVQRLDEPVAAACTEFFQRGKVLRCRVGRNQGGQGRGVGCDHQFVGGSPAQCQSGHALRGILVSQGVVAGGVGRLRNAPRHALLAGKGHLLAQRCMAGIRQDAAMGFRQHQGGHQVFEHGPGPRAQPRARPGFKKHPPQMGPVAHRHVAARNAQQAGQA